MGANFRNSDKSVIQTTVYRTHTNETHELRNIFNNRVIVYENRTNHEGLP